MTRDDSAGGAPTPSVARAIAAAAAVGVTRIVQVGCDLHGARWAVQAAERHKGLVAAVALHPNEAPRLGTGWRVAFEEIESLAAQPVVRAVGETGMDRFRTGPDGLRAQEESFRAHIDLAKRLDKTLVVHDRDAHEDIIRIVDAEGAPARVVMHCFSGDEHFARRCLERGWFLSFAGPVTFRNAAGLRNAAAVTPSDRLLVETDAPFLTPHPFRGKPNSAYLAALTARVLAAVQHRPEDEVCADLHRNAAIAFGGDWGEASRAGAAQDP